MGDVFSEPIVFVIDVDPIHDGDFLRTRRAVAEVVKELREDGIQVRAHHMAIRGARDEVLLAIEHG